MILLLMVLCCKGAGNNYCSSVSRQRKMLPRDGCGQLRRTDSALVLQLQDRTLSAFHVHRLRRQRQQLQLHRVLPARLRRIKTSVYNLQSRSNIIRKLLISRQQATCRSPTVRSRYCSVTMMATMTMTIIITITSSQSRI